MVDLPAPWAPPIQIIGGQPAEFVTAPTLEGGSCAPGEKGLAPTRLLLRILWLTTRDRLARPAWSRTSRTQRAT